jgi:hypothetical protein
MFVRPRRMYSTPVARPLRSTILDASAPVAIVRFRRPSLALTPDAHLPFGRSSHPQSV